MPADLRTDHMRGSWRILFTLGSTELSLKGWRRNVFHELSGCRAASAQFSGRAEDTYVSVGDVLVGASVVQCRPDGSDPRRLD